MSLRPSTFSPVNCSGLMYAAVPIDMPVAVSFSPPASCTSARDAEVGHHGVPALEEDVLRLDVAVHDALPMRIRQRVGHLAGDGDRLLDGQLRLAVDPGAQRLALARTA